MTNHITQALFNRLRTDFSELTTEYPSLEDMRIHTCEIIECLIERGWIHKAIIFPKLPIPERVNVDEAVKELRDLIQATLKKEERDSMNHEYPLFHNENGWGFWSETGTPHGPYETEELARVKLSAYNATQIEGNKWYPTCDHDWQPHKKWKTLEICNKCHARRSIKRPESENKTRKIMINGNDVIVEVPEDIIKETELFREFLICKSTGKEFPSYLKLREEFDIRRQLPYPDIHIAASPETIDEVIKQNQDKIIATALYTNTEKARLVGCLHAAINAMMEADKSGTQTGWKVGTEVFKHMAFGLEPDAGEGESQARCYDCGLPYGDPGFVDLVIPDRVWNEQVSPTGNEGGLLCPTCLVRAAAKHGIEGVEATFRSGPFCVDTPEQSEKGEEEEEEPCEYNRTCWDYLKRLEARCSAIDSELERENMRLHRCVAELMRERENTTAMCEQLQSELNRKHPDPELMGGDELQSQHEPEVVSIIINGKMYDLNYARRYQELKELAAQFWHRHGPAWNYCGTRIVAGKCGECMHCKLRNLLEENASIQKGKNDV